MNVHLLLPEGCPSPAEIPAMSRDALRRDLDLKTAAKGMAGRDEVIYDAVLEMMFAPLRDRKLLAYRQEVLRDVLAHPEETLRLYQVCLEADDRRAGVANWLSNYSLTVTYHGAVEYLLSFSVLLRQLRGLAAEYTPLFSSAGFLELFRSL